jgi:hypothetical protein
MPLLIYLLVLSVFVCLCVSLSLSVCLYVSLSLSLLKWGDTYRI